MISCLTAEHERAKRRLTMTLKRWVLWLCIAALLCGEFFLFSANRQKDAALVRLHEAREEAAQLRAQLDQLKNSSVATLSSENARLRAENQKLTQKFSQLQNENRQLHGVNQQMTQQLQTTSDAAQQEMQAEDQPAVTAPEPSTEQPAAIAAQLNTCINHLRQIDAAKQEWALENDQTDAAVPTALELLPYLKDGIFPACPSGGTYTINAVGVPPTCSIPGHVLPP
jgi:regulator of replication initiation timing